MVEELHPVSRKSGEKTNFFLGFFSGMALLAVVAFFVLLIMVFVGKQPVDLAVNAEDNTALAAEEQQAPEAAPVPPVTDADYFIGGKNAKVVLIEYTDFECPYCLRHHDTAKQIRETYGDKIKFVGRNFPLSFHPESQKAAEAVECAGEQGKYWQMYDAAFAANEAGEMGVEKWKSEAVKLGLNASKFNDCLDSGKTVSKIDEQMASASAAGVDGTPATFVNGQLVSGALPFESFKQIIDGLLGE